MNSQLCKDCREGIGPTIRYFKEAIGEFRPDMDKDRGFAAMKLKWLDFFGADTKHYELKKRINKIEEEIKILKGGN